MLRFLTEVDESTELIPDEFFENAHICEAVGYVEIGAYTKAQLDAYDKRKVDAMTVTGMLDDALEKGEAIGEHKKACYVAQKAIEMGMTVDDASRLSDLTVEQINEI